MRVRAATLTNFQRVAVDTGLNPAAALAAVGINESMLHDPEQLIPQQAVLALLENAARDSGCPTFGLRMAALRQFAHLGAISLVLNHQPTLRDALQMLVEYRHLMNNSLNYEIEDRDHLALLGVQVAPGTLGPTRQANELALGVTARMCAHLLGPAWKPAAVHFTHARAPEFDDYLQVFGCHPVFNADTNAIVCSSGLLDAPNPRADPLLAKHARRFLGQIDSGGEASLVREVRDAICMLLPRKRATIEQVAASMGLNVRTLQRRLTLEQLHFSDMVDSVRRDSVQRHLSDRGLSVAEVSELLGYSVHSSFTRWFVRQFNQTPQAWRYGHAAAIGSDSAAS